MALYVIRARFNGSPPSAELFRRELAAAAGDIDGLEGFHVNGDVIEVRTMLDERTYLYAEKLLLHLGGQLLDFRTLEPRTPRFPAFVERPWRAWPWWKRGLIRIQFFLSLLSPKPPSP